MEMVDELCRVFLDFQRIMKEFGVEDYRACATSAVRESKNNLVLLDRIRLKTGIKLEVLENRMFLFIYRPVWNPAPLSERPLVRPPFPATSGRNIPKAAGFCSSSLP